jgi:hypothetical protein
MSAKWWELKNDKLGIHYLIKGLKPFCESELGKSFGLKYGSLMHATQIQKYYDTNTGWVRVRAYETWDSRYRTRYTFHWYDWTFIGFEGHEMNGMRKLGLGSTFVMDVNQIKRDNGFAKPNKMIPRKHVNPEEKRFWGKTLDAFEL